MENRITVLFVYANQSEIGGADYCLFKLANELDKNRFRAIACFSERTPVVDLYEKAGIKVHIINMVRIKKKKNILYFSKLILFFIPTIYTIFRIVKEEKVDIIHGNDFLDFYGPIVGKLKKIPSLQYIRWILVSPGLLRKILSWIVVNLNDRVLTVSDGVANAMFKKDGIVNGKVITAFDWVDMDAVGHDTYGDDIRKGYHIPSNASVVGCVGRLEKWKGQDVFIKAAAEVLKALPNTYFIIVGSETVNNNKTAFTNHLKDLVKTLGIDSKVIFTGNRGDIIKVMSSFDILVHSSIDPDPLPGVVLEAMYCECPVVGANAGGVPEEIEDNVTGLLYQPGNHIDMSNKIVQLLNHPGDTKEMGKKGKKRIEEVFNKNVLCKDIEDIYINLLR